MKLSKYNINLETSHWWIPIANIFLGIAMLAMMGFSFWKGLEMNTVYAPLINADTEVKLKVVAAHMWVEEILGGDQTKDTEGVWRFLDQADWYANAMLEGGQNEEGTIMPLNDPEIREVIREVRNNIAEFRKIAHTRLSNRATSGTGSPMDKYYDEVYLSFNRKADRIKHRLQELMATDLQYFKVTQITLMGVMFLLSMSMALVVFRFERFRDKWIHALHEANVNLEKEVEERKQAEVKLTEYGNQLRRLTNQLQSIREEEKTRIAREVHDELGQTLTALKMELACLVNDVKQGSDGVPQRTRSMSQLIDSTIQSVQRIATELRPQILDVLGLSEAIRWETAEFEKRTGMQCHVKFIPEKVILERNLSTTLFRIYQEAMTNVARHSGAKNVTICVEEKENEVILEICDDGRGIQKHLLYNSQSLGLLGIQERARALDGETTIEGQPTSGTTVRAVIPVKQKLYENIQ
ncbi:sensor histidine kinase [Nitrospina sp. 32_T5]|uniref:sensor histidine kinase n=1 Tax=unclassified Nitrospina TaxID=2638683 RepID=UPI003F9A7B3B